MKNCVCGVALAFGAAVSGTLPLVAMPTAKEIEKVAPIVEDLMKADVAKMKQGKCSSSEVGESAVALAKAADTQAAKYYLLTSAVPYFANDGKYDRIVATLDDIKTTVPDVPVRDLVQLVEQTLVRAPKTDVNANRLRKMVDDFRAKEKSEAQAEKMRLAIARNPSDRSLHTKLAEHMAVMDNWEVALTEFAQGDNKDAARTAKAEKAVGGVANVGEVADAWWNYADGKSKPVGMAIRKHAIELYRSGIAENKITGLAKVQAERRIAEFGTIANQSSAAPAIVKAAPSRNSASVCEYSLGKDVKLRFEPCANGTFAMGWPEPELSGCPGVAEVFRQCEVKISKDFLMANVLVSERTWAALMGGESDGDKPKEVARGEADEFIAKFKAKFGTKFPAGYTVRLPTYAEYEYALKSGGAEQGTVFARLNPGLDESVDIRQDVNVDVMSPKPNQWGLRGMRLKGGSVWIADQLSFNKKGMTATTYRWDAVGMRIGRIDWPKSSVDPQIPLCGGQTFPVYLNDSGYFQPYGCNGNVTAFFRLVLAPKVKEDKK